MKRSHGRPSFALVSTLLIVAVMALGTLAFFQAARMDRLVTRNTADRVQAELAAESGLAAGRAAILSAIVTGQSGTSQWNYISGHLASHPSIPSAASNADANAFSFISQIDPINGNPINTRYLASVSPSLPASNTLVPLGRSSADPRYPAQWVNLVITNSQGVVTTNARYAFWISDDTTKLNFRAMGRNVNRTFPSDPAGVSLIVRTAVTSPVSTRLPAASLAALFGSQTQRAVDGSILQGWNAANLLRPNSVLLTPGMVKAFMTNGGLTPIPTQSLENDFARETLAAPVAPNGRPKLNLTRLKTYLDSMPRSQAPGNLRYQLILDILNSASTNVHANWGGGDLSFLVNPTFMGGKYTATEARQFVANLFDAIDEDFIPTTDNENSPTIFGVEFRSSNDSIQGHPYITFVGTGHFAGRVNPGNNESTTRSHATVGFVNPWPQPTEPWASYRIEIELTPSDNNFPAGRLTDQLTAMPSEPGIRAPNGGINSRIGAMFPCANNITWGYSAQKRIVGPLPAINNLRFTLSRVDLRYNASDGGSYLVARVPPGQILEALPSAIAAGGDGVNRNAWQPNRQSYWAQADPRLATTANTANWGVIANGSGGLASGVIPGPQTPITYLDSQNTGDGAQGLSRQITGSSRSADNWYRDQDITNHFNMDGSLFFDGARTRIRGLGFLGFLSVGKPWQTLSLSAKNNPAGQEDWKIFDYVYAGDEIYSSNEIAHVNMGAGLNGPGGARASWPGNFSRDGSINVHTVNRNTWRSVFEGIPVPAGFNATTLADAMAASAPTSPYRSALGFMANATLANLWADPALNDFEREKVLRYSADMLTSRSRNFTIYAMGEILRTQGAGNPRPVARSLMLCRVRIGLNTDPAPATGGGVQLETIQVAPY